MRKTGDIDAELKVLQEKAKQLKAQRTIQLDELVEATGADTLSIEALAGVLLAAVEQTDGKPEAVARWTERGESFFQAGGKEPETIKTEVLALERRIRKQVALIHRHQARKARTDMRDWAKARRERTRHLIELGGLVQKAGLVDLTDDERATMLGAFLDIAGQLQGDKNLSAANLKTRWRRRGLNCFRTEREDDEENGL